MIFTENLKKAKNGDEYAYKLVCNEFVDGLYAAARFTLNTSGDAEKTVKSAFSDGFNTVAQIKDRDHLCAWLAHELAKHIVACLKKYRDEGEPDLEIGENTNIRGLDYTESVYLIKIRRDIFGKLAGLDRLAAALNVVFGYDSREVSIITGLSEAAAVRKILNAENAFAAASCTKETASNIIKRAKAPEYLYTPEKSRAIPFDPPAQAEPEEKTAEKTEPTEKAVQEYPPEQLSEKQPEQLPDPVQEQREPVQNEKKEDPKNPPREINARMFIGIISSQHIKGGEFLQLMGNTRISNSAYREIEQNPNLTKERLIELLEESGLTTADYYKVLTAIKYQKDIDSASTRAFSPHELESLKRSENAPTEPAEDIKPAKPLVLTPEEKPVPTPAPEHKSAPISEQPLSVTTLLGELPTERDEVKPAKPLVLTPEEKPAPASAPEHKPAPISEQPLSVTTLLGELPTERDEVRPAKPRVLTPEEKPVPTPAPEDMPDSMQASESSFEEKEKPAPVPAPVAVGQPEAEEKPFFPEKTVPVETPLVTRIEENEGREKYKSNEFFYDDDAYEPGVNNGKIAFCAVCAVLLFAGSFLCRYLITGDALPTEKPAESVVTEQVQTGFSAEKIVTDEDVIAAVGKLTINERRNSLGEYYVSKAYESILTSDFCEVGESIYVYNKGILTVFDLGGEEPSLTATAEITGKGEFIGFAADPEHVYALTQTKNDESGRKTVTAEIFDSKLTPLGVYVQDGDFAAIHENNGTLTVLTVLKSAGEENPLPTYSINGESKTLTRGEIEIPDNIVYNDFTVFGTLSGSDVRTTAVLGGYDAYVSGEGDSFTLLLPDYNKTYLRTYRVVGITAELQSEEIIDGELYGAEGYNAEKGTFVVYDSAESCTKILKKSESGVGEIAALGTGETLKGAAFSDELTYVITENAEGAAVLYCCGADGSEITPDSEAVYSKRLSGYGENLIGLSAAADENGARAGLRLSVYGYDGKLSEKYGTDITVDEKTAAEYVHYLSGDAEENSALIAQSGEYAAVSCVYFDGVSEIERFLCFKDNSGEFEVISDILLFDIQSDYRYLTIRGETLYIMTDSTIVTADLTTGKAAGYFQIGEDE